MSRRLSSRKPHLSSRELATILAALRHFQRSFQRREITSEAFSHFDRQRPLSVIAIDNLCERLNTGS